MLHINALIPIAGNATRLYPQSLVTKKSLLPIYHDNVLEPAIYILIKEILNCKSIDKVFLVIAPGEEVLYTSLLAQFSNRIKFIVQENQQGLGHAVYLGKGIIGDRFLLCLGDMIYKSSDPNASCIQQIVQYGFLHQESIMGLHYIPLQDVSINGMVQCIKIDSNFRTVNIQRVYEKPTIQFAVQNSLQEGVFGCYILNEDVFGYIDIFKKEREGKEIELSPALDKLAMNRQLKGYILDGESYDIGTPEKYYNSFVQFGRNS